MFVVGEKIDMAMAVSVSEIGCWSWKLRVLCERPKTPLFLQVKVPMAIRLTCGVVVARAMDPKKEHQNSTSSSQEDLVYVGKLVAGCFAGGAAIKYGSGLFPEITSPNIVVALLLILTPMLIALLLLINQSRTKP